MLTFLVCKCVVCGVVCGVWCVVCGVFHVSIRLLSESHPPCFHRQCRGATGTAECCQGGAMCTNERAWHAGCLAGTALLREGQLSTWPSPARHASIYSLARLSSSASLCTVARRLGLPHDDRLGLDDICAARGRYSLCRWVLGPGLRPRRLPLAVTELSAACAPRQQLYLDTCV